MTDFEKEHNELLRTFKLVGTDPNKMEMWISLKRIFINKYIIRFNPTEPKFNKIQNELRTMENELTKKLTQGYLF